jgi:hypothetical protein
VRIPDKAIGLANNFVALVIIVFFVWYVLIVDQGYYEYEPGKGATVTHPIGEVLAAGGTGKQSRYFSVDEITHPGLENGNVMVATQVEIEKQNRGTCTDPKMSCSSAADCSPGVGATCEAGLCKEPSWCVDGKDPGSKYDLETGTVGVWVKSSIQFVRLAPDRLFTSQMSKPIPYPAEGANVYTIDNLLKLCQPPLRFAEVKEAGAVLAVEFVWDCDVDQVGCDRPHVQVRRIDSSFGRDHAGFSFEYPIYSGPDTRELHKVKGIRLFLHTVGTGKRVSFYAIVLKCSMALALLGLAPLFADLVMLHCLGDRSDSYFARKYDMTEDFGEAFRGGDDDGHRAGQTAMGQDIEDEEPEEREWRRRMVDDD